MFKEAFIAALDKFLKLDSYKSKNKKFSPSMVSSPCVRKAYYHYNLTEPDFEESLDKRGTLYLGSVYQNIVIEILKKNFEFVEYKGEESSNPNAPKYEFPVKNEDPKISGRIDGIVIYNNEPWMIEIKSSSPFPFEKLNKVKSDHLEQGALYFELFNRALAAGDYKDYEKLANFKKLSGIFYIYVNKVNLACKVFQVTDCSKALQSVLLKMKTILNATNLKVLPEKTEFYCDTCPYRLKCKKNENPVK